MSAFSLEELEQIIAARAESADGNSYTAALVKKGMTHTSQKVGEEAVETLIAALSADRNHLISESADLLYHLLVMWKIGNIRLEDVLNELERRTAQSGLQEKADREHAPPPDDYG